MIRIAEGNYMLCNYRMADKWFLSAGRVMQMVDAENIGENFFVEAIELLAVRNCFECPFQSSRLNIFAADINCCADQSTQVNANEIDCKFFVIQESNKNDTSFVFVPLLHTEKINK